MTKKLLTLGILALILGGIYIPTTTFAQTKCPDGTDALFVEGVRICDAPANTNGTPAGVTTTGATPGSVGNEVSFTDFIFGSFFDPLVKGIGYTLMTLSAGILTMVGSLFDFIVKYTIIDMAKNIGDPEGVGGSISAAWRTLRDIANMLFIFVLLFVAFKAMFQLNFNNVGKSVTNIIIVALLINFSLFFSKVVIDASNIVSVGFYNSIITANTRSVGTGEESTGTAGTQTISTGYMKLLGLQSWYSPNILIAPKSMTTQKLLIVGVFSSVFMLITAIVLLISAIMFVARFIILVFLMILSPLALIAIIIPEQGGKFEQWKKALIDQAFFAPIFFALTWVVFKVASTPGFLGQLGASSVAGANAAYIDLITKAPTSSMGLVLNYVLVIGFAIAALVISKQMATRTAGFSAISGGLGTIGAGGAALLGRSTIGFAGKKIADRAGLQEAASKKGFVGSLARATLYTSKKARSGSFDVRNAAVPTSVISDTIKGTVGRTGLGKAIGLDDVNIPNVELGNRLGKDIWGTADTKGYKERKEESEKRLRTEAAASASELTLAKAKNDVVAGSKAPAGSPTIGDMEKALASLSDKETEALVASNRELLDSQNFANAISVKQLETLNKSDQFSDEEKGKLKSKRFSDIDTAMSATGPTRTATIGTVRTNIRNLSDSELEMIAPAHLEDFEFVGHLKSSQFESINKSSKFTTNQKDKIRAARRKPLADAIVRRNIVDIKKALKSLGPKEVSSLEMAILKMPPMLESYTSSLLKRMAPEMNPADVIELRDEIEAAALKPGASPDVIKLKTWLGTPDGAIFS